MTEDGDVSVFHLINQGFTVFLMGALFFGIKGGVVLVYQNTTSQAHVFTIEIALMWSLALSTCLFFGVLIALVGFDAPHKLHTQNIYAYLVAVVAMFVYSLSVVVNCSARDDVLCTFLYPVSRSYLTESCINLGILCIHLLTTLAFALSLPWARAMLSPAFAWGGSVFTVINCLCVVFVHAITAMWSCPSHVELGLRAADAMLNEALVALMLSALLYTAPSVGALAFPRLLDGLRWDGGGAPTDAPSSGFNIVGQVCVGLSLLLCSAGLLIPTLTGFLSLPLASILSVAMFTAVIGPVRRWLPFTTARRGTAPKDDGDDDVDDDYYGNAQTAAVFPPGFAFAVPPNGKGRAAPYGRTPAHKTV